jgi:general secretion pathway protein E
MSELDIAERRVPQDGRFKARHRKGTEAGRDIDFRVSVMPSVYGEDAVLRILDRRALTDQLQGLSLDALGFSQDMKNRLRQLSREPYGMLLVTGPTGSGKTTTLYAVISEVNKGLDKIITIEDPVEYHLPGVLQIPVNEQKGLTFARLPRSCATTRTESWWARSGIRRRPRSRCNRRSPATSSTRRCTPTTPSMCSAASGTWGSMPTTWCPH